MDDSRFFKVEVDGGASATPPIRFGSGDLACWGWDVWVRTELGTDAVITADITGRQLWRGAGSKGLSFDGVLMSRGGVFFFPFPSFSLTLIDVPASGNTSEVYFLGRRVLLGAPWMGRALGHGFEKKNIGAGATGTFAAPAGASHYRVAPGEKMGGTLETTENPTGLIADFYIIDPTASVQAGADEQEWRLVPSVQSAGADVAVKNTDSSARDVVVHWRYDFRTLQ